jgi:tetratricopeptide (TPR) repeat protein
MGLTVTVGTGLGRYDEALRWADHATVMFERAGETEGLARLRLDLFRATVHRERGEYAEAQRLQQHVLAECEQRLGPDHPYVADALNNLGNTLFEIGQPTESLALLRRAFDIRERSLGPEHPDVAASAMNLAVSERANGRLSEAIALGERSVALAENALGPNHPALAASLVTLATFLQGIQPARARALMERAIEIEEAALGPDHPDVGESRLVLGVMLGEHGDIEAGMAEQRRALAIFERRDPNDVRVAMVLHNLAHRAQDSGALSDALVNLERALAIVERSPETRMTLTGRIRVRLAEVRRDLGEPELARQHVAAALATLEPGTDEALEKELHRLADELGAR